MCLYMYHFSGTAEASRLFNEALAKIAVSAQQGGTSDIGMLKTIITPTVL